MFMYIIMNYIGTNNSQATGIVGQTKSDTATQVHLAVAEKAVARISLWGISGFANQAQS